MLETEFFMQVYMLPFLGFDIVDRSGRSRFGK